MKCCFAVVLSAAICFAQTPGEATVSGRVTDAITHQPIAGATVLYCCVHRADAVSDADGRYSFHVKADATPDRITVARKGYAQLDPGVYRDEVVLSLKAGDAETRDFELSPAAHLSGHVTDRDSGKPLAGFVIMAAAHNAQYGFEYLSRPTDADGAFAIVADLNPGDYTLEIDPPSTGKRSDSGYGRSWFPDVPREDMAAPVTVSSGENRDIELRLQERELHHIAGVIQVPEGKEHVGIIVKVSPNLRVLSPIAEVNLPKAGPFRIEGLDPGTYRVTAAGTGFPPFTANQIVELTNRDVEDLRLNLRVGVGVRAVVTMAEQNVETPGDLRFEPDALFAGLRAVIKLPQDHLSSSGYPPGEYWPVISVPKGYAVTSVTFNGQPVVNTCIDLEAPESTVNVVLTSRPSGIAGIVRDDNRKPIPEASVALLPESLPDTFDRFDRRALQVGTSDSNGAFRFAGLAPGRYRVIALTGGERDKARDLVFLRDRMRSVDAVALDFGQTSTLDLVVK